MTDACQSSGFDLDDDQRSALEVVLERARTVGFLGPGPLGFHIDHAGLFAAALPQTCRRVVDIGSGGGLPGLPIALALPEVEVVLLDAMQKRTSFLVWAVAQLGLGRRVDVVTGRAEVVGREAMFRESADAVVSRGFGPPATTLECASGFVREGGVVVVSEPPRSRSWPKAELAQLGLRYLGASPGRGPDGLTNAAVFERVGRVPEEFPRSSRHLKKAPLFDLDLD